jgi:dolichol-phosphate mannosyltransferase
MVKKEEDGSMRHRVAGGGAAAAQQLSVVVPTFNETENIRPLCERLSKAARGAGLDVEVLIVDDESAGSAETKRIVEELKGEGHPVRIHCRKKAEGCGLSSAVLLGFKMATHPTVLCMDADLQHEPESMPDVARPVLEGTAEFAVGSRHAKGGGVGFNWSAARRVVSKGATLLAWPVATASDPMSGFFCTTKEVIKRGEHSLNSIGFKIGLEVMVRCRCSPVVDVAITFQERNAGESKLSAKQYRLYLEQLSSLYWDRYKALIVLLLVIALLMMVWLGNMAAKALR